VKKRERQMIIKQLIMNEEIVTQDELLQRLKDKGAQATQATISRDIKQLNLIKTPSTKGGTKYTFYQEESERSDEYRLSSTISGNVTEVTLVQFLNVVNTLPSNAHVIGALVDDIDFPEIVGTVAGNDTILLISEGNEDAEKVNSIFRKYLNNQ